MNYYNMEQYSNPKTYASQPESSPCMTGAKPIPFSHAAMGYDREQVDEYLQKLMSEYSSLQQSYTDLKSKYDNLPKAPDANMDAIAKALVDAQISAKKIIEDAKIEASMLVREANRDLARIQNEKEELLAYINGIVDRVKGLTQ